MKQKQKKPVTSSGTFDFATHHPSDRFPDKRPTQELAYPILRQECETGTPPIILNLQCATGSGKSILGYAFLKTLYAKMQAKEIPEGPLVYITPKLNLIEQLEEMFPGDVVGVKGRHGYHCLYYSGKEYRADEIPCAMLKNCPHRVNREDGTVHTPGAERCGFLNAFYRASHAPMMVCSMSFFILTQLSHAQPRPVGLVIDEAHKLAEMARMTLSSSVSDRHLSRCIALLERFETDELRQDIELLKQFHKVMIQIINSKPVVAADPEDIDERVAQGALLTGKEIGDLLSILRKMDSDALMRKVQQLVTSGKIDAATNVKALKALEVVAKDLKRYTSSFGFALPTGEREALDYICAYSSPDPEAEGGKARRLLEVCNWYVAGLLPRIVATVPYVLNLSASFGDFETFSYEVGFKGKHFVFPSTFPPENRRFFMPTDVLDLSGGNGTSREKQRTFYRIAKTAKRFARNGIRCVVIVNSKRERRQFLEVADRYKLEVMTCGVELTPAEAIEQFMKGEGEALLGLGAHLIEGVDLRDEVAPVIFLLKPGFPLVGAPGTQFEIMRMHGGQWKLWIHRAKIQAQQGSGRNIRSENDRGVIFLMSSQFRRFAAKTVPEELKSSYRDEDKFEKCVQETFRLLGKEEKK